VALPSSVWMSMGWELEDWGLALGGDGGDGDDEVRDGPKMLALKQMVCSNVEAALQQDGAPQRIIEVICTRTSVYFLKGSFLLKQMVCSITIFLKQMVC
jgi:hypothetical protein